MVKAKFFMDLGEDKHYVDGNGETRILPRYGVWAYDYGKGKDQCVDTGSDLEKLIDEYGNVPVIKIGERR